VILNLVNKRRGIQIVVLKIYAVTSDKIKNLHKLAADHGISEERLSKISKMTGLSESQMAEEAEKCKWRYLWSVWNFRNLNISNGQTWPRRKVPPEVVNPGLESRWPAVEPPRSLRNQAVRVHVHVPWTSLRPIEGAAIGPPSSAGLRRRVASSAPAVPAASAR